ncbi:MAG: NAD-dependent epimerase/dehydratase family protein, partial [Chloroflexota bacterium]
MEVVQGDICDASAVREAMRGVSRVYHLAGSVSLGRRQAPEFYRTHVDGTRNVCEAALQCGVEKLVVVSSSGTIAVSRTPVVHREDEPYANDVVGRWPYYLSKIFQEKLAFYYQRARGLPVVVVNPSLLVGPGEDRG